MANLFIKTHHLRGSRIMNSYVIFIIYLVFILGFILITLFLNALLGPKPKMTESKGEPFECGSIPIETENVRRVPIKYYAIAILFLLFDLEGIFLYIWAVGAEPFNTFMFVTFLIFMFILVWALLYVWRGRLLDFLKQEKF
jgi:NADH-quinone oxidoreductase subunit A